MNLSSGRRLIGCVLLGVAACATRDGETRSRELDQCRVASHSGDELTRCLAVSRNWRADSAQAAGRAFQAQLDSVERAMQVRVDSALKAQRAQAFAAAAARARRWTECALRQFVDAGELPVSQGEMDACGQKPTMEELAAYVTLRQPSVRDSVVHRLQLYIPEP